jgi:hypothetical protein
MRDLLQLKWNDIVLVFEKTSEACRKVYSNQKLIEGLPPKEVTRKKTLINATIGVKLKKKMVSNPKISYRKLAGWLQEEEGVHISIEQYNVTLPKMIGLPIQFHTKFL